MTWVGIDLERQPGSIRTDFDNVSARCRGDAPDVDNVSRRVLRVGMRRSEHGQIDVVNDEGLRCLGKLSHETGN